MVFPLDDGPDIPTTIVFLLAGWAGAALFSVCPEEDIVSLVLDVGGAAGYTNSC